MRSVAPLIAVAAVASCTRVANVPVPTHTIKPDNIAPTSSARSSSKAGTTISACSLLTADERLELAGESMDQVVPANKILAEHQCQWVHSFRESATASISVDARDASEWVKAMPNWFKLNAIRADLTASQKARIDVVLKELASGHRVTPDRACDIYALQSELMGYKPKQEVLYPFAINRVMVNIRTTSCEKGVYTVLTYGKYRLYPNPTLGDRVVAARKAAQKRAIELYGTSLTPTPTPTPTDGEKATPEPTPTS